MKKVYENGDIYEGKLSLFGRKRTGKGKMTYKNGDVYEGEWKNDKRHGYGKMTYKYNGYYWGYWENDKFHGEGKRKYSNGTEYEGHFVNGVQSGQGKTVGNMETHEGNYAGGYPSGLGTKTGVDREKNLKYTYEGSFTSGSFDGSGKITYSNGDWYKGQFRRGEPFSFGSARITLDEGVYEGNVAYGKPANYGKLTAKDGTVYIGNFKQGKMNGEIKITYLDGTTDKKRFIDGKEEKMQEETKPSKEKKIVKTAKKEEKIIEKKEPAKKETVKKETAQKEPVKKETPKKEAPKKETLKKETLKKETPKKETPKKEMPKQEAAKKEAPKTETKAFNYDSETRKVVREANQIAQRAKEARENAIGFLASSNSPQRRATQAKEFEKRAVEIFKGFEERSKKERGLGGAIAPGCFSQNIEKPGTGLSGKAIGAWIKTGTGYGVFDLGSHGNFEGDWKNHLQHGVCLRYENGVTFVGEMENGKKRGCFLSQSKNDKTVIFGKYIDDNKIIGNLRREDDSDFLYEGEIENGVPNGNGVLTVKGAKASFEFVRGSINGYGKRDTGNETFEGYYHSVDEGNIGVVRGNNYVVYGKVDKGFEVTGIGKGEYGNGTYVGGFEKTCRHGYGRYKYTDGDVYEGFFDMGKRTGKGRLKYADGTVYEGDFVDGELEGKGKKVLENGDIYEGEWEKGYMHGKGKYTWTADGYYEGDWANDNMHGKGKRVWENGDIYEGDYINDKRTGKGKIIFGEGDSFGDEYEGDFVDGKITGKGVYKHSNGDVYEGEMINAQRHGQGKYIFADGSVKECVWENGYPKE